MLLIAKSSDLLSHTRFFLTLRSKEETYKSLILFRLSGTLQDQLYIMESSCPHLGADLSHADIEDFPADDEFDEESDFEGPGVVAVCPWHRYDFNLHSGKSQMAPSLRICTFAVHVDGDQVFMKDLPEEGTEWRVVELRGVSEEFADPPPPPRPVPPSALAPHADTTTLPLPQTLMEWAVLILNTADPMLKVERTKEASHLFFTSQLSSIGHLVSSPPSPPRIPPRHEAYTKSIADPIKIRNRKNRASMIHALANIEQWAVDLAWDIIVRFGPKHKDLPKAFFYDFVKMARDEAKHFSLLVSRLHALSPSTPYGSLPVHTSLWSSALATSESLLSRLAIIHLVHEARGLDVNPQTIERFRKMGDSDSVAALEIIHADEVTHVTTGHRWFTWMCQQQGEQDVVGKFREQVREHWTGELKPPFNHEDREKAGLRKEFYEDLKGEAPLGSSQPVLYYGEEPAAVVNVEYDK